MDRFSISKYQSGKWFSICISPQSYSLHYDREDYPPIVWAEKKAKKGHCICPDGLGMFITKMVADIYAKYPDDPDDIYSIIAYGLDLMGCKKEVIVDEEIWNLRWFDRLVRKYDRTNHKEYRNYIRTKQKLKL